MRHVFCRKVVFLLAALLVVCGMSARKPIKTLLITGQNNHNWQVSHVVLKQILENSGRFSVDFAVSPEAGKDMSGFVLIYHAADNAFVNWPEYNKICALGGWENRDEKAGPYVYWSDGKLIKDSSAGVGGSHGKQHEYVLNARNHEHPIMKGLPNKWKHAQDELYDRMRGPGNIKDCLYTAYSDKETGGSGREEPLIFTVDYGNARIFHTMLGHAGETVENCPAMQCAGFQITLLRGAEWAATGKVTQKVPADFPTEKQVSNRSNYKR